MDLVTKLEAFRRVLEAGSFSAAARQLRRSVAAVSRQIDALEAELGAPLLVRSTRKLRPTEAGARFYEHTLRVLREIEDARASVRGERALRGELTVSASVAFGLLRVVPMLPAFRAAHPSVRLELRIEDRTVDLVGEGVDVAIRAGLDPPDGPDFVVTELAVLRRCVVASPSYLSRRPAPQRPEALADHEVISGLGGLSTRTWRFGSGSDLREVRVTPVLRLGTPLALRDAAIAGLGVALLPEFVAGPAIERGALVPLLLDHPLSTTHAFALRRVEHKRSPRAQAFVEHLVRSLPKRERPLSK